MKILLCKGQFLGPISGADETIVTYATHLRAAGHSVSVLLMYPHARRDQYYVRLSEAGVPVSSISAPHVRSSLGAGRKLVRGLSRVFPSSRYLVRENGWRLAYRVARRYYRQCRERFEKSGADLIHVLTPDPGAMVMIRAAHEAGIPVIYQELGTPYHPPDYESFYGHFTSVLPLCTEVAALSPRLAEYCRETLPFANSLSILPIMTNGLRDYSPVDHAPPQRDVTFGFAARIEPLKGPMFLVEAFAATARKFADIQLKLAGVGSEEQQVAEQASALGIASRCHFPGIYTRPEQKSAFMRSLDAFVLPSLTEGTPNCIAEAMAHGLPVIASAVGGIPDVVTDETGILVPPGDACALAHAMLRLAEDPALRKRLGRAGRKRYEELFSPRAVLPLMLSTYERVAGRNGLGSAHEDGAGVCAHPWVQELETTMV
ncbi:MAG TPA: glycosyltransferase family 4 protein [Pyrinomonadaceae bacterium]